jgi:hypothetical protein
VILSVKIDIPTGAVIVVTFGGVLTLMFFLHLILHHGRHARVLEGATRRVMKFSCGLLQPATTMSIEV